MFWRKNHFNIREKRFRVGNARVNVIAKINEDGPTNWHELLTNGEVPSKGRILDILKRNGLTPVTFVSHFLEVILDGVFYSMGKHPQFVTNNKMQVQVIVDPPKEFSDGPKDSELDDFAEYRIEASSPSVVTIHAYVALVIDYLRHESVVELTMTHELQHHASAGFQEIVKSITHRWKELSGQLADARERPEPKMGLNSWIVIFAVLRLKDEGLSRFAERINTGIYPLYFDKTHDFAKYLKKSATDSTLDLRQDCKEIFNLSYKAGVTIMTTILCQRILEAKIPAYFFQEGEHYKRLERFSEIYGRKEWAISYETHFRPQVQDIAHKLIKSLQGESHLKFFNEYERACLHLRVYPIISKRLYEYAKLDSHNLFKEQLRKNYAD